MNVEEICIKTLLCVIGDICRLSEKSLNKFYIKSGMDYADLLVDYWNNMANNKFSIQSYTLIQPLKAIIFMDQCECIGWFIALDIVVCRAGGAWQIKKSFFVEWSMEGLLEMYKICRCLKFLLKTYNLSNATSSIWSV